MRVRNACLLYLLSILVNIWIVLSTSVPCQRKKKEGIVGKKKIEEEIYKEIYNQKRTKVNMMEIQSNAEWSLLLLTLNSELKTETHT